MKSFLLAITCLALLTPALACQEEGPAEKLGKKMDEAAEKIQHGSEGTLEKAGRHVDEAVDDANEKMKEMTE